MKKNYFDQLSNVERALKFTVFLIERTENDPSDVNMSILNDYDITLNDKNDILKEIKAVRHLGVCCGSETMITAIKAVNQAVDRVINQLLLTYKHCFSWQNRTVRSYNGY